MLRMTAPFAQRSLGKATLRFALCTKEPPLSLPFLAKGRWHGVPEGISHGFIRFNRETRHKGRTIPQSACGSQLPLHKGASGKRLSRSLAQRRGNTTEQVPLFGGGRRGPQSACGSQLPLHKGASGKRRSDFLPLHKGALGKRLPILHKRGEKGAEKQYFAGAGLRRIQFFQTPATGGKNTLR